MVLTSMRTTLAIVLALASLTPIALWAQKESGATDRLDASTDVLSDMMKADDKGIPQDLMNKADCVIVVPNMKKAGFIFGANTAGVLRPAAGRAEADGRLRPAFELKEEASDYRSAAPNRMLSFW